MSTLVGNEIKKSQSDSMLEIESPVELQNFRIANIERLRILAIFGIIWFHTGGTLGRSVGYAGLPVFIMIFCALAVRKPMPDEFMFFAKKKARRLLKPWLFWSILYIVFKILKQLLLGGSLSESFASFNFFVGPRTHLWYLPFAFVCGLIVNLLHHYTVRVSSIITVLLSSVISILCLFLCSVVMSSTHLPVPVPQWLFGLPGMPLGFAIGQIAFSLQGRLRKELCLAIVLATESVCLLLFCLGYTFLIVPYGIAVVLVCIALLSRGRSEARLLKFSSLAYGIYLVHPLVGSVLYVIGIWSFNPMLMVCVIFLVSSATILIMQKTPLRQFV